MLCVVAEVTERVIGERQLATLRDLGSRLAAASTRAEVMTSLEVCLAEQPRDLPFARPSTWCSLEAEKPRWPLRMVWSETVSRLPQ